MSPWNRFVFHFRLQRVRTGLAAAWLLLIPSLEGAPVRVSPLAGLGGLPPPGAVISLDDLLLRSLAVPHGNGWAIPLIASRPGWYTAGLARQVIEAGGRPVAAPNDAPLPGVVGIRPGAWMVDPNGCTLNFVFTSADGGLLIGTAGHCVEDIGQRVVILTLTPNSNNPVLLDIGTVVFRRDDGIGDDFALVSIRPELSEWVSPTTAVIGGPCGSYAGAGPAAVSHYGHGLAIGAGGTPRAGVALIWEADAFGWASPAISGDSGSPVLVSPDQQAAGDLTHLVVDAAWLPSFVAGTRIQKMLGAIEGLKLASSPLCGALGIPNEGDPFIRGDSNSDGALDISDPIYTLFFLFASDGLTLNCLDAADADDSGILDITDPIRVLEFLFLGGPAPPAPFPDPGPDPTPDPLGICINLE